MLKRIAITGPESTGKSWLTEQLALTFKTHFVPEFARAYLSEHGLKYTLHDVETIAKGQLMNEEKEAQKTESVLFCDTDVLVTKIWCDVVFGQCPEWIEQQFLHHKYDLYLLCYPDIPWEPDPMRENPDNRHELFQLYKKELDNHHLPYKVVKGLGKERLENAINFVKEIL